MIGKVVWRRRKPSVRLCVSERHDLALTVCFCDEEADRTAGLHRRSGLWNGLTYECVCGDSWLTFGNVCSSTQQHETPDTTKGK